jgi:dTMP kinase
VAKNAFILFPDLVCFLDVSAEEAAKRGGFGAERYENKDFQDKVRVNYDRIMQGDPTWKRVDTDAKSLDQVKKGKILVEY